MQGRLDAMRIISRWENSMLSPNEQAEIPCAYCDNPIDEPYHIGRKYYCSDCAKEMHKVWITDDEETVECVGCGELIPSDEPYFEVGDDRYCEQCFREIFKEG